MTGIFTKRIFAIVLSLSLALTGCSNIISRTTGSDPVGTSPSKRSLGRIIDDEVIETYARANILKAHKDFRKSHFSVISYNGIVLLVGQVKSDRLRKLAATTAAKVRNVRRVHNEITVSGPTSGVARTNDLWLKTKIKSRMTATRGVSPLKIKVVVENGVVYLMGLMDRSKADKAVALAHKTYGVQKIVKVFEYL